MMNKSLFLSLLIILCLVFSTFANAHNPFITKPEKQHAAPSPVIKSKLFVKIILWQHQLKEKMSSLIRQFDETGDFLPLFYLFFAAFIYGSIHAAGPGHGKFLALSYMLSRRPNMRQGILFGSSIALFHGLSGILFVVIVKGILEGGITNNMESLTHITQIVSFSLISCVGFFILFKGAMNVYKQKKSGLYTVNTNKPNTPASPLISALIIGIIPCPGVVIVMLFALSMGMVGLGVMLGAAISMGMAVTITTVVIVALSGKALSLSMASKNSRLLHVLEHLLEIASGLLIAVFGLLLLLSNL